jgi:hypothetical protein
MSEWRWLENPAYAGRTPQKLTADCHDGSPFITIQCSCGFDNHVHRAYQALQLSALPLSASSL